MRKWVVSVAVHANSFDELPHAGRARSTSATSPRELFSVLDSTARLHPLLGYTILYEKCYITTPICP